MCNEEVGAAVLYDSDIGRRDHTFALPRSILEHHWEMVVVVEHDAIFKVGAMSYAQLCATHT